MLSCEWKDLTGRGLPEMSVVIVTPDRYERIRTTIRHLRAQAVRNCLEIVIVAPSARGLDLDEAELADFAQFRLVEIGLIETTGRARAAGVRAASAPVVAFAEDHSYPDPGWGEALIISHRQPWAAVGPAIVNANPDSLLSWANLFLSFGPWVEVANSRVTDRLPWHNSSYKRAVLLDYGPRLEAMLDVEGVLQEDLRARGYRLYLESAARTHHENFASLSLYIRQLFYGGRWFASARVGSGRWSLFRRLLYLSSLSLSPLVRFMRTITEIRRCGLQRRLLPRVLPSLLLGLTVHAVGEMTGCAFGAGRAPQRKSELEIYRSRAR